jgi:DNA-binding transcriptional regulator YdaS (Cro superfamily)
MHRQADPYMYGSEEEGAAARSAAASLAGVSFESAIYQWQQGERRLRAAPPERVRVLERVADGLVTELRRRLGGGFTADELAELYDGGTSWCLQAAMRIAPDQPWAWEAGVVIDAAFNRYLREAADYAGGRREIAG